MQMGCSLARVRAGWEVDASPRLANTVYAIYALVNTAYAKLFEGTMPRPELYPVKKVIGFNREQLSAIDRWRRSQSPIPTVSDAIRQLVEQSLAATKSARRSREETSEKAAELAAQVIEKKTDKSQPVEEQKARKRKLISGPSEFRDVRRDQPKQISQQRRT